MLNRLNSRQWWFYSFWILPSISMCLVLFVKWISQLSALSYHYAPLTLLPLVISSSEARLLCPFFYHSLLALAHLIIYFQIALRRIFTNWYQYYISKTSYLNQKTVSWSSRYRKKYLDKPSGILFKFVFSTSNVHVSCLEVLCRFCFNRFGVWPEILHF